MSLQEFSTFLSWVTERKAILDKPVEVVIGSIQHSFVSCQAVKCAGFHGGHPEVISVFRCPFASDWLTHFAGPPELDELPGAFLSSLGIFVVFLGRCRF